MSHLDTNTVKRIITIGLVILGALPANAQSELTLPLMGSVFQSTYYNPTSRAEHTVSIGLPGISSVYFQAIHSGFVPSSIVQRDTGGVIVLQPSLIPKELRDHNMISTDLSFDLFHLRIKSYNWDFWLGARQRVDLTLSYSGDMFRLLLDGTTKAFDENPNLEANVFDFSKMGVNSTLFGEISIGGSAEVSQWVIGGSLNLLQGQANIHIKPDVFELTVDPEMYNLSFDAQGTIHSAGIPVRYDSVEGLGLKEEINADWAISRLTHLRNPGVSLSGGAAYMLNHRTTFTFAFRDLGFIRWTDGVYNQNFDSQASFSGVDMLTALTGGEEGSSLDSLLKFDDIFAFEYTTDSLSYTTWLSPKFLLAAEYRLARRTSLGIQFFGVYNRSLHPALTLSASQGLGRFFSLHLSASYNQRTFRNLGFGLVVKPGPFQFYIVADNYYPVIDPLKLTNLNIRAGMNLVFGRVKRPEGLPYR